MRMDTKKTECDQLFLRKRNKELLKHRVKLLANHLHSQVQPKASQVGGIKRFQLQNPKKQLNILKQQKLRKTLNQPGLKSLQLRVLRR